MGIVESYSNLSASDKRWLDRALGIANTSTMRMKHGCIIVRSNSVLSVGINSLRNNPSDLVPAQHISYHAEVAAIKAAGRANLEGAKLYVGRINRAGNAALSRPCDGCSTYIRNSGIAKVIYSV